MTARLVDTSSGILIPEKQAIACLGEKVARELHCLPLALDHDSAVLTVAMVDCEDVVLRDRLISDIGQTNGPSLYFHWQSATRGQIARGLDLGYGFVWSLDEAMQLFESQPVNPSEPANAQTAPLVRLVDAILQDAIGQRASDIHINPEEQCVRLRYRVDGVLRTVRCLDRQRHPGLVVRLKIMASMDIAESKLPQDGQFSRQIHAESVDFRVSSFPLMTGENLVLRVLDPTQLPSGLSALGLDSQVAADLCNLIQRPDGLTVVCGPTGAGKSTTLHALLAEKASDALNIMTLEDPVEYVMPYLRQASVDAHRKLDFANGVRGLLRQDPDVLLIGEVRDLDSCAMALRAAMSGHQVLTTVHSSSAVGAIARLIELGAEPSLLASSLTGVIAQRLLRRRCFACLAGASSDASPDPYCMHCRGSGYHGRVAIMEILVVTPALVRLIESGADTTSLHAQVEAEGMRSLRQSAEALLSQGLTTPDEIRRVLGLSPESTFTEQYELSAPPEQLNQAHR